MCYHTPRCDNRACKCMSWAKEALEIFFMQLDVAGEGILHHLKFQIKYTNACANVQM